MFAKTEINIIIIVFSKRYVSYLYLTKMNSELRHLIVQICVKKLYYMSTFVMSEINHIIIIL